MHKKPVLLEIIDNSVAGGAEKSTMLISKEFLKLGYEVVLVHPKGEYDDTFRSIVALGGEVVVLPVRSNPILSIIKLRKLITSKGINCIHSHQIRADFIVALATLGLKSIQKVTSVHCLIQNDVKNSFVRFFYYCLSFFSYRCFTKVITVSRDVKRSMVNYYHLREDSVVAVMNSIGFDDVRVDFLEVESIKSRYGIGNECLTLCCVGELSFRKNQELLIRALAKLELPQTAKLILLGKGSCEESLRLLAKELNVENDVIFAGHQMNIYDWVELADLYLQPSINDPLPRALLEAMYLKKACITTNLSSIGEVIKHDETGLWIENSVESFVVAISSLASNPEERSRLGKNAHKFIEENCSMETMAKGIAKHGNFPEVI